LNEILQIVSVSMFEQVTIEQLFATERQNMTPIGEQDGLQKLRALNT
jgi:hypothetical protein